MFWQDRALNIKTSLSAKRAASDAMDMGVVEAQRKYRKRMDRIAKENEEIGEPSQAESSGNCS